jgi:hypothetical protein
MHDPRDIRIDPNWNGRIMTSPEALAHISALEASILKDGVREAIKVRYDTKTGIRTLVAGQCRLTACLNLRAQGHKIMIPCERVEGDEIEMLLENLTSNAGLPLTQWEAGAEYRKLIRWGQTVDDIAARVCKPKRYVTDAIALSNTSIEAKAMLAAGEVTPGAVLHAVKEHGPEEGVKALKEEVYRRAPATPEPKQSTLPGSPAKPAPKPKPIARPKKLSAKEEEVKKLPTVYDLADTLARLVLDDDAPFPEVQAAAKTYLRARNIAV